MSLSAPFAVTLRARLVVFALLCAIPVLVLSLLQHRREVAHLHETARQDASQVADRLHARTLVMIAHAESIGHALGAATAGSVPPLAACSRRIAYALEAAPFVQNYALFDVGGRALCSGQPVPPTLAPQKREFFQRALRMKRPVVSGFEWSRLSGLPSVLVAVPLLAPSGEVRAVAVTAFPADAFTRGLAGGNGLLTLVLVDPEGVLVSRRPADGVFPPGHSVVGTELFAAIRQGSGAPVRLPGLDGRERLYELRSVMYREEPVFMIAAGIDTAALEAVVLDAHLATLAWVLLVVLGVTGLAVLATRPLVLARCRAMLAAAAQVSSGRYEARVPLHVSDDLTPVEQALNHMLSAVEHDRARLKESEAKYRLLFQETVELNRELERRVRQRTRDLETANRELTAFSYTVSHDLRGPVAVVESFAGVLQEREAVASEKDRHYLERIRAAARHMNELIEGLLALANITRTPLDCGMVDLSALAREAAQECRDAAPDRLVELHVDDHMTAFADGRLVRALLANLLANAWKFTSHRPLARIAVTMALGDAGEPVFTVRDNGAGFDEAHASHLFQPFHRLHKASEFPGLGIGLATVQRIVHRHGGRVWAQGVPDAGASFHFVLGAADVPRRAEAGAAAVWR